MQLLAPDAYAALRLPDQWIEDECQQHEAQWLLKATGDSYRILDLGYGSGIVVKALAEAGRHVTLVDGAIDFVQQAAQIKGVQAVHSMFEDFAPVGKFDCVIASFVLEHVQEPTKLLMRCKEWADKLIVVIGNANSYHRQLAVQMGLQPRLDTLSGRDIAVGHYRVYSLESIDRELKRAGWKPTDWHGIMLKVLPNSMMAHFDPRLIRAMCEIPVPLQSAANIGIVCRQF